MATAIDQIAALFEQAGVAYAVIGAHAVNAWIEPRLTADIDVTALLEPEALTRLEAAFTAGGMRLTHAEGRGLPSGPDFVRSLRSTGPTWSAAPPSGRSCRS